jgi:hypothetical protein
MIGSLSSGSAISLPQASVPTLEWISVADSAAVDTAVLALVVAAVVRTSPVLVSRLYLSGARPL